MILSLTFSTTCLCVRFVAVFHQKGELEPWLGHDVSSFCGNFYGIVLLSSGTFGSFFSFSTIVFYQLRQSKSLQRAVKVDFNAGLKFQVVVFLSHFLKLSFEVEFKKHLDFVPKFSRLSQLTD